MGEIPETRFALHGDSHIAYQVLGQGPPDIVFLRSAWNHVELQWEDPRMARLLTRLASIGRLIVFDPRGSGLSDAFLDGGIPTVEDWADDTLSVLDAVGSDRAAVVCSGGGTTRAIPLAASHPERVISLVVCDGFARMTRAADYPFGRTEEEVRQGLSEMVATWGRTEPIQLVDGEVGRFRGRVVKSTGDGHLATFDGPGRALTPDGLNNRTSPTTCMSWHRVTSDEHSGRRLWRF